MSDTYPIESMMASYLDKAIADLESQERTPRDLQRSAALEESAEISDNGWKAVVDSLQDEVLVLKSKIADQAEAKAHEKKPKRKKGKRAERDIPGWSGIRSHVIGRDGGCCIVCKSDSNLHVHHIDRDRSNNDYANLSTLCRDCHAYVHLLRVTPRGLRAIVAESGKLQNVTD